MREGCVSGRADFPDQLQEINDAMPDFAMAESPVQRIMPARPMSVECLSMPIAMA